MDYQSVNQHHDKKGIERVKDDARQVVSHRV
jgi:hypothetical protein